ncbi:MAG: serine--tRNA ligase [Campylobacterota bacterium]|nr:serine--tRNA ligase [Campylobacterota bacterium]
MIDLKLLQKDFETISIALMRKNVTRSIIDALQERNEVLKTAKKAFETLQAEQNAMSKLFGQYKREGKDIAELKEKVDANKETLITLQDAMRNAEEQLTSLAMGVPNIPDADVPDGKNEDDNVEIKKILTPKTFDFTPKEHWELAEQNGWIDFERGVKISKSRFSVSYADGARLERALINFMLDFNRERGFIEVSVPVMVNRHSLESTGQLPKFEDDLFKIEDENLFLIPTAEVPLANLFRDEIVPSEHLPILMNGYTPCFRKEAGSAGRDTRGIIRQHQFHKVELVSFTKQENSDKIFDMMVETASDLLTALELPHRVMRLCTGDLGFSAAKTIDLEVWLPGQNTYREISSISNTRDFQARRAKIRYKEGKKNLLVHTLNGSALAVGRTMVALMENGQNSDGSISLPSVLNKYL